MDPASVRNTIPGLEFKDLYFAERARRQSIRQQMGVPVTVISFAVYGFVTMAAEIQLDRWPIGSTPPMLILFALSVVAVVVAVAFLVRTELGFLATDLHRIEVSAENSGDPEFFANTYTTLIVNNRRAERDLATAFVGLLTGLLLFVLSLALLPFHLAG